jgi:hypothetical protein
MSIIYKYYGDNNDSNLDKILFNSDLSILIKHGGEDERFLEGICNELQNFESDIIVLQPIPRGGPPSYIFLYDYVYHNLDKIVDVISFIINIEKISKTLKGISKIKFSRLWKKTDKSRKKSITIQIIINKKRLLSFRLPSYLEDSEIKDALLEVEKFVNSNKKKIRKNNYEYDRKDKIFYPIN